MNKPTKNTPRKNEVVHDTQAGDDAVIGTALKWSLLVIAVGLVGVAIVLIWMNWPAAATQLESGKSGDARNRDVSQIDIPSVPFTDVTESAGITFRHVNGAYGDKLLPETMGGGAAFFDYDNDGDQDLLLINSSYWPDRLPRDQAPPTMALYRNDGTGQFEDVTAGSGLDVTMYGMGVAVGDFDNDGWRDVFISAVGANRLFRNDQGRFVDVTGSAGVAGGGSTWSCSCGWFDYNNDGRLDLFVCNYVQWNAALNRELKFTLIGDRPAYGPPTEFRGEFPYLYRNDGDGWFTDVSSAAGLHATNELTGVPVAKALGVVFADVDRDGYLDILVANDTTQNQLFRNRTDGTFEELGARVGVADGSDGKPTGAMGIDAARFRNTNSLGIAIGNFAMEPVSLYVSEDDTALFAEEATSTGLGPQTLLELSFGLFFFDCDLDGRLDLLAANGHLEEEISQKFSSQSYAQPAYLFWNAGAAERTEFIPLTSEHVGNDFHKPMVGRAATYADIDGDGDLDVLITATGQPPRLLRNDQQLGHHWLRLKLVGVTCNRDAVGAEIEVRVGGQILHRTVSATRSYLAQTELPVTFGLGANDRVEEVVIRWPDRTTQQLSDVAIDKLTTVRQAAQP